MNKEDKKAILKAIAQAIDSLRDVEVSIEEILSKLTKTFWNIRDGRNEEIKL